MTTDKAGAAVLAELFEKRGLEHMVISPGSRNAPLVIAFTEQKGVMTYSIVDERSAAYFALGIAQQTKKASAVCCTSGGAVLNYAPAIAEAYYQKIPLLIVTADRPKNLVDQGDGQTIRQNNVFANYIKASFEIPGEINDQKTLDSAIYTMNQAIDLTETPGYGPVHLNIPFEEPIYNRVPVKEYIEDIPLQKKTKPELSAIDPFIRSWNKSPRKLLIAGMMHPDPPMLSLLKKLTDDPSVVLLTETTSNLMNGCSCPCIDKVVHTISEDEAEHFRPEILLTFGGHVVSKMIKSFLRKYQPQQHWHVDLDTPEMNTYFSLTHPVKARPFDFLTRLSDGAQRVNSNYAHTWQARDERSESRHVEFLRGLSFSDLQVFELLMEEIPEFSSIQLGNSTAVRYAQLFKQKKAHTYFSNRGTSGIDGTVSTAAGAACVSSELTTLITGDLGFLYDSNALMNHHLTGNLRIVVINNGGGGIFRFIPGPDQTGSLEQFFEASHSWSAEGIAGNFQIPYFKAHHRQELLEVLPGFFASQPNDRPALLEVFTPPTDNAALLRTYFKKLKE